jgi:hypothetical protein
MIVLNNFIKFKTAVHILSRHQDMPNMPPESKLIFKLVARDDLWTKTTAFKV